MTYEADRADKQEAWARRARHAEATALLVAIRDRQRDPLSLLDELERAAQTIWASDVDDRLLVYQAITSAVPAFRDEERFDPRPVADQLCTRARLGVLLARAEHSLGQDDRAFKTAYTTLLWLEDAAGGRGALADALRWPRQTLLARIGVSLLAVYAAAMRGARLRPSAIDRCVDAGCELVRAYASAVPECAVYATSAELADAWRELLVARGSASDRSLIAALATLSVRLRRGERQKGSQAAGSLSATGVLGTVTAEKRAASVAAPG